MTIDDRHPTGMMLKTLSVDGGDPTTEYFRRGSAASTLSLADYVAEYVLGARHLHVTGIAPALGPGARDLAFHLMREMKAAGRTVSFDPNLRPALWPSRALMIDTLNALAGQADIVMPGLGEAEILTGTARPEAIAEFYLALGAGMVVIKLGERGAFVRTRDFEATVPGVRVEKVVDTVGAGDGFAVGFLSALLEGKSVQDATARGNWIGALAVQVLGDSEGLPVRAQLDAYERSTARPLSIG